MGRVGGELKDDCRYGSSIKQWPAADARLQKTGWTRQLKQQQDGLCNSAEDAACQVPRQTEPCEAKTIQEMRSEPRGTAAAVQRCSPLCDVIKLWRGTYGVNSSAQTGNRDQ